MTEPTPETPSERTEPAPRHEPKTEEVRTPGYLRPALEISVRLLLLGLILWACLLIARPFLLPLVWGIVIAVALHAPFVRFTALIGGRRRLAGVIFIVLGLALILGPTAWLGQSGVRGALALGRSLQAEDFELPALPDRVLAWPVVGEPLSQGYAAVSGNLTETFKKLAPQLKGLGAWLAKTVAAFGTAVIHSMLAVIIAGIVLIRARFGAETARSVGRRLGGEQGAHMVDVAAATIASVFKGVVLVALIQGTLAGLGFFAAGIPRAGLWSLAVIALAVVQLPAGLVLIPAVIYVFYVHSTTAAVVFTIWSLLVLVSDNVLKPMLLGRGVKSPMLVILIGAIGGMLAFGILGLFLGAVILSIGYELARDWLAASQPGSTPPDGCPAK
jgi:predicted PurR-regulated permease PerM